MNKINRYIYAQASCIFRRKKESRLAIIESIENEIWL